MAKLFFRYGAMNSGKTTILLQTAHNYEERGMKVLIIKPKVWGTKIIKIITNEIVRDQAKRLSRTRASWVTKESLITYLISQAH